jgi:hypothetical protein
MSQQLQPPRAAPAASCLRRHQRLRASDGVGRGAGVPRVRGAAHGGGPRRRRAERGVRARGVPAAPGGAAPPRAGAQPRGVAVGGRPARGVRARGRRRRVQRGGVGRGGGAVVPGAGAGARRDGAAGGGAAARRRGQHRALRGAAGGGVLPTPRLRHGPRRHQGDGILQKGILTLIIGGGRSFIALNE